MQGKGSPSNVNSNIAWDLLGENPAKKKLKTPTPSSIFLSPNVFSNNIGQT